MACILVLYAIVGSRFSRGQISFSERVSLNSPLQGGEILKTEKAHATHMGPELTRMPTKPILLSVTYLFFLTTSLSRNS